MHRKCGLASHVIKFRAVQRKGWFKEDYGGHNVRQGRGPQVWNWFMVKKIKREGWGCNSRVKVQVLFSTMTLPAARGADLHFGTARSPFWEGEVARPRRYVITVTYFFFFYWKTHRFHLPFSFCDVFSAKNSAGWYTLGEHSCELSMQLGGARADSGASCRGSSQHDTRGMVVWMFPTDMTPLSEDCLLLMCSASSPPFLYSPFCEAHIHFLWGTQCGSGGLQEASVLYGSSLKPDLKSMSCPYETVLMEFRGTSS